MTDPLRSWCVTYERQIQYEVITSDNLFDPENTELLYPGVKGNNRRFVVVDSNVELHYGDEIRSYFDHHVVHLSQRSRVQD
jgi:hypothetical protein